MATCLTPFVPIRTKYESMAVPCGKCANCLARRTSAWSFRLMQEDRSAVSAHFVTLTYDTKSVPISLQGFMVLDRLHITAFFKRLRRHGDRKGSPPLKFYCVGEYGSKTKRPHYHAIIFNASADDIQKSWGYGDVFIPPDGSVSGASVGYVLKYISKYEKVPYGRTPTFACMSRGLGKRYLTPANIKWHKADLPVRMYVEASGGVKISMPRYYKDRIYDPIEREQVSLATRQRVDALPDPMSHPDAYVNLQASNERAYKNALKGETL